MARFYKVLCWDTLLLLCSQCDVAVYYCAMCISLYSSPSFERPLKNIWSFNRGGLTMVSTRLCNNVVTTSLQGCNKLVTTLSIPWTPIVRPPLLRDCFLMFFKEFSQTRDYGSSQYDHLLIMLLVPLLHGCKANATCIC